MYLDQRALLLGSIFKTELVHYNYAALLALTFFYFESHACHMPSTYLVVAKAKYTKHRWLLKPHHTQIRHHGW